MPARQRDRGGPFVRGQKEDDHDAKGDKSRKQRAENDQRQILVNNRIERRQPRQEMRDPACRAQQRRFSGWLRQFLGHREHRMQCRLGIPARLNQRDKRRFCRFHSFRQHWSRKQVHRLRAARAAGCFDFIARRRTALQCGVNLTAEQVAAANGLGRTCLGRFQLRLNFRGRDTDGKALRLGSHQ